MPSLLGTAPNQVSVNSDLGKLAFMDVVDTVTNNPYLDTAISDTKPSLLLDFANSKTLDPRITYTRASTATYYDGKTTAVAEQNLLLRSQEFDNASWGKSNVTVTGNTSAAPDGTTTAESMVGDGVATFHLINQSISALVSGNSYVFSVFAKANGLNFVQLHTNSSTDGRANFDITAGAGAVGTVSGAFSGATITDVGNGWYRCSAVISASTAIFVQIALISGTTAARAESFATSSGILIWGAQLEQRSAVSSYTPTTSSPITNYIPALQTAATGVPRFDHDPVTGESKGFLIEEQRSNLVTYSADFLNAAWTSFNSTTGGTKVAPDGSVSALEIICGASNSLAWRARSLTVPATTAYTASVYFTKGAGGNGLIRFANTAIASALSATFNLDTGAVVSASAGLTVTVTSVGNNFYRCACTLTTDSDGGLLDVQFGVSGTTGNSVYIWGAQLEAGSFATSYIPTTSAQVTRSADAASMTGANFSSWYNQGQGTTYVDYSVYAVDTTGGQFVFTLNGDLRSPATTFGVRWYSTAQAGAYLGEITANSVNKVVVGQQVGYADTLSRNGASIVSTSGVLTSSTPSRLDIGYSSSVGSSELNGTIKKLAYYPKRLSDAELQEMTQ